MRNTFGNSLTITLFGESHGEAIGVTIDGLSSGIRIDEEFLNSMMDKRKPKGTISTMRKESDEIHIVSGVFNGYTTGTPLTIIINNENTISKDYESTKDLARPSHADYSADKRYLGYQDYRGGGHFSGRLTAPIVAAGAICMMELKTRSIKIASHIKRIGNIEDDDFNFEKIDTEMEKLNSQYFAVLNDEAGEKMQDLIEKMRNSLDSVGGVIETVVTGFPEGVGEPYFDSVESIISHGLFSIGAIKAVEFGDGIMMSEMMGSKANDAFRIKDGKVITMTNHNGGINGGITNGMPITIHSFIKPTPSIARIQDTVNFKTMNNETIEIKGRHDPCIVHRIRVVIDSMVAIALTDLLMMRSTTLTFNEDHKS